MSSVRFTLDKIDLRILRELQKDGRLSNVELAERVSLSSSPCLRRLKQLEDSGVISQYVALLNPAKIGLGLQAFVRVKFSQYAPGQYEEFLLALEGWTEVINCYAMTGEIDYLLQVYFQDMDHFSRFIMNELIQYPGVEDVKSSFVLREMKRTTALPLAINNREKT